LPRAEVSQSWAGYLELRRTEWSDAEEIRAQQLRQLRALLAHAARHVPYYRALLAEHAIGAEDIRSMDDVRRLPLLSRRTFQERFSEMVARRLPAGTRYVGAAHTSGSSGIPVEVGLTDVVQAWWFAFQMRDLEWCGIDPRESLASIRPTGQTGSARDLLMDGLTLPAWPGLDVFVETGPAHLMDINQDPRRQLEWLCEVAPTYLITHPSNLDAVVSFALEQGRRIPGLRAVHTFSEALTDDVRARAERALGAQIWNTYSSNESGYLASPCPLGDGLHVHAENALLEVLDPDGRPSAPGEPGRVVLTTLLNFATPLIRYDIEDGAVAGLACCKCGRGLPLLARVAGKRHLMLDLPAGGSRSSSDLMTGLREVGGFHQFQVIVRRSGDLLVRVVPDRSWTERHPARMAAVAAEHLGGTVDLRVVLLDQLPLPPSGKLLDIVKEP
jgi:phenylacetate-CoA ligase